MKSTLKESQTARKIVEREALAIRLARGGSAVHLCRCIPARAGQRRFGRPVKAPRKVAPRMGRLIAGGVMRPVWTEERAFGLGRWRNGRKLDGSSGQAGNAGLVD